MHQQRALHRPSMPPRSVPPRTQGGLQLRERPTRPPVMVSCANNGEGPGGGGWGGAGRGFEGGQGAGRAKRPPCVVPRGTPGGVRSPMMISSFASCSRRHLAAAGDAWRFLFEQQDGDVMGGRRRAGSGSDKWPGALVNRVMGVFTVQSWCEYSEPRGVGPKTLRQSPAGAPRRRWQGVSRTYPICEALSVLS